MKNKVKFFFSLFLLLIIDFFIGVYFYFASEDDDKLIIVLFFGGASLFFFFILFLFLHIYKKSVYKTHIEIVFFVMSIFVLLVTIFLFENEDTFDVLPIMLYIGILLASYCHIDWSRKNE